MTELSKRTVRVGRIYYIRVANAEYRAFIWQSGKSFCGRVEEQPQVQQCRGSSVVAVQTQLTAALAVTLAR